MEQTSNRQTDIRKWIIAGIVLVAAIAVFILSRRQSTDAPEPETKQATLADAGGVIETPVGQLTFPEEWADSVHVEETRGEAYSAEVYAYSDDEDVFLFRLLIGGEGNGYLLGYVPDEKGDRESVWLDISAIEDKESRSAEESQRLNTIQGCVNDLIEQIREMEGFSESE